MNFNIVRKPKKDDDDEIMDEDELELEEEKTKKSDNDAKLKMFRFMGFIVGGTIILLFILYLFSLLSVKSYTYEDVEKVLKDAAIAYFKEHPEHLPQNEGDIAEIDSSNLTVAGKMKDISKYPVDGNVCSGTVHVEKSGTEYLYTPYLNCGDSYSTVELYRKITSNENVVSEGYGLYSTNNGYAYRGETINNYVKLDNSLWRIVKVTSNNNVVLINDSGISLAQPWDNRYNETRQYESGINQYSASRIKEYLDRIYKSPIENDGEDILSDSDKAKIINHTVCTGKRSINSSTKDNSEECKESLDNQKLSLLTLSDYINASIDSNCKSAETKSCKNYNYLSIDKGWWLVTANKEDDSKVYKVDQSGILTIENASNYSIVRPVIYLNSNVMYKSGTGTKEDPYILK